MANNETLDITVSRFWKTFFISLSVTVIVNAILLLAFFAPISLEGSLPYESALWPFLVFAESVANVLLLPFLILGDVFDKIPFGDFDLVLTYAVTPILEALIVTFAILSIRRWRVSRKAQKRRT